MCCKALIGHVSIEYKRDDNAGSEMCNFFDSTAEAEESSSGYLGYMRMSIRL